MLINPIAMAKREDTKELIQEFLLKHRKKIQRTSDQRTRLSTGSYSARGKDCEHNHQKCVL